LELGLSNAVDAQSVRAIIASQELNQMSAVAATFLFVVVAGLAAMVSALKQVPPVRSWLFLNAGIVVLALLGLVFGESMIYAAAAFWVALVLAPTALAIWHRRLCWQRRYGEARRVCRAIICLHPSSVWRAEVEINRALELAACRTWKMLF
jgi:glucose dehydrogenase